MSRMRAVLFAVPVLGLASGPSGASELGSATATLCADGTAALCSTQPTDMANKPVTFGYNPNTSAQEPPTAFGQRFVDFFGWQAFVALNWPVDGNGKPSKTKTIVTDTSSPRVWSTFRTKDEVFGSQLAGIDGSSCPVKPGNLKLFRTSKFGLSDFTEAFTPYPLIDRQGNFVLYDVRINEIEVDYLKSNNLLNLAGQKAFKAAKKTYVFPQGQGSNVGAIEIKSSWRVMTAKDDPRAYYTSGATIVVPPAYSENGQPLCIDATVGLVGMHIMQKFKNPSAFGEFWSWATFEHVLNAPLADKAPVAPVNVKSPLNNTATPPSCAKTADPADRTPYSFYDSACAGGSGACPVNAPPVARPKDKNRYLWAASQPYAASYLTVGKNARFGTQVARCFAIYDSARAVTATYAKEFGTSPWANYMLVGAQWAAAGSEGGGPLAQVRPFGAPIYLANTTSETYLQTGPLTKPQSVPAGSCVTCHSVATDSAGSPSNFSFLPGDVR